MLNYAHQDDKPIISTLFNNLDALLCRENHRTTQRHRGGDDGATVTQLLAIVHDVASVSLIIWSNEMNKLIKILKEIIASAMIALIFVWLIFSWAEHSVQDNIRVAEEAQQE